MLIPGRRTPALSLPLLGGGTFDLDRDRGDKGTLLVFYRGLHCPLCIKQMTAMEDKLAEFDALGVAVVNISADTGDRARQTAEKAGVAKLKVAHSLPLTAARDDWGLWISAAREGTQEPAQFNEPGLFLITGDRMLHFAWVQSVPFARPSMDDVLGGIRFQQDKDYPPRGTYDGPLTAA